MPCCLRRAVLLLAPALALGCGTTRMTDTQRTATEQLLISNAVDQAVSELDVRALAGKPVYFDPQYLDGCVDRGYLISSIRQHLLANGCVLQEDRAKATYVVEARAGGIGTDRTSLLLGIPQMSIPTVMPGLPASIPEIPLAKKTDQNGTAKIAVYAYNRVTGRPVWQSGVVEAQSSARDSWFFGAGPFQKGSIRRGTEFAGQPLPTLTFGHKDDHDQAPPVVPVTHAVTWTEPPTPSLPSKRLGEVVGAALLVNPLAVSTALQAQLADPLWSLSLTKPVGLAAATPPGPAAAPAVKPVVFSAGPTPNAGGFAETEPSKVWSDGMKYKPDG
jgi:hypothetical protein